MMKFDGFTFAFHSCSSNNLLQVAGPTVKQKVFTATRKIYDFTKWLKPQLAVDSSKNVQIMNKPLELREGSVTF